jgi:hypothetical protein
MTISVKISKIFPAILAAALIAPVSALADGPGHGHHYNGGGNSYFDPSTVQTLTGTLTQTYSDWVPMGHGNFTGTGKHFEFTAGGTVYSLILGPPEFLEENGIFLSVGDTITVTGSIVEAYITGFAEKFIIVTRIGDVDIRDENGYPLRRGGNGKGIGIGPRGEHYFDPATVEKFNGTLTESLRFWSGYGDGNYTGNGMHYLFESDGGGTFYLMLGPYWYLEENGIELEVGLKVKVTGSVVQPYFEDYEDQDYIIATEITANGVTVKLRDEEGYPLWRSGNALCYNSPDYDGNQYGTLAGTVVAARTRTHGKNVDAGYEVVVRSGGKRYVAYLAPQWYCEQIGLSLAKGDQVRLRGSLQNRAMVVRTLDCDGDRIRLRDRLGNPRWVVGNN